MDDRRSHRFRIVVSLILVSLLAGSALADGKRRTRPQGDAQAQLADICAPLANNKQVSVFAREIGGKPWIAMNADTPLKPASVMKLFTTAAALHRFGPDFNFETRVYLAGDELWIIGGGDPAIGDERVEQRDGKPRFWLLRAWAQRVKELRGDRPLARLVLDDSIFDDQLRHPEWPADQYLDWYQAPVGGLCLNDNCFEGKARAENGSIFVTPQPPLPTEFFSSTLTIGKESRGGIKRADGSDLFEFTGTVKGQAVFEAVSVNRPTTFFGFAMRQALADAGVTLSGPVVRRTLDHDSLSRATLVATHRTPIRDVVWRANNFSQNLFAECLIKSLAAYTPSGKRADEPGGWATGSRVLRATLEQLGVQTDGAKFDDGSGLGHGNRVSAVQIVQLLEGMRRDRASAVFLESLAVPGRDGTLRRRFAEPLFQQHLRAKTGTIKGVSTLAGYVDRPDGKVVAFAIMINGAAPEALMQNVVRALIEAAPAD